MNRPLFFRRMHRWRNNAREYAVPFSKKGLLRGYIKYGILAYMSYHYLKKSYTNMTHKAHAAIHNHGHGQQGHGHGHH